jgi:hypothetical protein
VALVNRWAPVSSHGDVGNAKAGHLDNVRLARLAALVTGRVLWGAACCETMGGQRAW